MCGREGLGEHSSSFTTWKSSGHAELAKTELNQGREEIRTCGLTKTGSLTFALMSAQARAFPLPCSRLLLLVHYFSVFILVVSQYNISDLAGQAEELCTSLAWDLSMDWQSMRNRKSCELNYRVAVSSISTSWNNPRIRRGLEWSCRGTCYSRRFLTKLCFLVLLSVLQHFCISGYLSAL